MVSPKLTLILAFMSLVSGGCSHLSEWTSSLKPAKKFVIERQWVRNTLSEPHLGFRLLHQMQPLVSRNVVIQGNSIDGLTAYDKKTGNLIWRLPLRGGVEAGAQLVNGFLYFGANDGQFYSVNAETGHIRWTFPLRSEGLATPTVDNGEVFLLSGNNVAYALNADTGKQVWLYNRRDSSNISVRGGSRPAVIGDKVFLGFSDGFLVALNRKNGGVIWERSLNRNRRFKDVDAGPIADEEFLYVSAYDDGVYCLKQETGQILWRTDLGGATSVTLAPQKVFYATSTGEVVALERRSGKMIWKRQLRRGVATRPVLYRGLLVYGESDGVLQVVSSNDGAPVAQYDTGRGLNAEPHVDPETGETFLMSVNANLFSLRMAWKSPSETWPWER
ncbi:MAG: PQQ-binding-like beta-propeller repeat protein [Pseudobdellovibrionaceae bacterium]|nr:MAG: PQQ-binding-like beta-propeller repeat protein [Pseudobdellovibrionaceae bacterium]